MPVCRSTLTGHFVPNLVSQQLVRRPIHLGQAGLDICRELEVPATGRAAGVQGSNLLNGAPAQCQHSPRSAHLVFTSNSRSIRSCHRQSQNIWHWRLKASLAMARSTARTAAYLGHSMILHVEEACKGKANYHTRRISAAQGNPSLQSHCGTISIHPLAAAILS